MLYSCASVVAAALCGAVLYRCRGGFIGTGSTTVARLMFWAVPTSLLLGVLTPEAMRHPDRAANVASATVVAVWLGLLIPHGVFQNKTGKHEFIGMTGVAFLRLGLIALAAFHWIPHIVWLPFFAPLHGAAYALGWHLLDGREPIKWHPANRWADDGSGVDHFAISGSEWGEVLTGLFIWGAIVALLFP